MINSLESLIKGRIAEHIVELLLEESGYRVIRIAREGLLNGVPRFYAQNLKLSDSAGKIVTAPPLAIFDKKASRVSLVKIKFWGGKSAGGNIYHGMKQIKQYWPEAILLVVSPKEPYFVLVSENGEEKSIEENFTQVKKESLDSFGGLVGRFLK